MKVNSAFGFTIYSASNPAGGVRMAKRQNPGSVRLNAAAEIAGRALGKVAGTVDSLKARHPHPITEAREALVRGRKKLTALTSEAGARATVVVKNTKAAAKKTRKVATRARRQSTKVIAEATRTTRTVVKRAKKVVRRARKTVSRGASRFEP